MFGVVDDAFDEFRILHEEIPIEGKAAECPVLMCGLVFGGLSVANEEEICLLILHVH